MTASRRTALALVWLVVLIGAGFAISQRLQVSGDLRKFMPGHRDNRRDQKSRAARAACRNKMAGVFVGIYRERWA